MGYAKLLICLLVSYVSFVVAQDRSTAVVKAAFRNASIPEDLHINFNPNFLLEVTFPQPGRRSVPVTAGVQLPRNQTVGPPHFAIRGDSGLELGQHFVVATVDPDAPTPQDPTSAQIRHFLGSNFILTPGALVGERPLNNLTVPLSNWLQPTPPAGSDAHRYVFLLFRQPRDFSNQTLVTSTTSVANFNISSFAAATHLGNPIAGTFIRVAPDPCEFIERLRCLN
ncbi:PEBP-like protein [Irpex rosettiformis]|uniref:PEBP-like protein n=1 Tax=Irpex rosettiformis TaxID=378272 RepID=A0ACB8TVY2_9APHY|nr:PEBP-like protein [Irpex rosettiformis]